MNDEVKAVLKDLARAINDGLEQSAGIAEGTRRLEGLGYRFALYLEATILLTREGDGRDAAAGRGGGRRPSRRRASLKLSDKDRRFLKSLKITLNEKTG